METKKAIEKNCLEMTQNYISRSPCASKYILELLLGDVIDSERPDFLIKNKMGVIGVEHFLIDTMKGRKKSARSRSRKSEIQRTFDKYHNSIDGNEENAINDIEAIVQSDIDAVQNFDYLKFISEFKRIVNNHYQQVKEYKEQHKDIVKFAFLIEISISKNEMIGFRSGQQEKIKGNRFPITNDILKMLKNISDKVDYVIISVMRENYHKRPFAVYAFDNSNFEKSITPQFEKVYDSFTYAWQIRPYKAKLKLNLEQS